MFTNRKERAELLEGLVINNKDPTIPRFVQVISVLNSSCLLLLMHMFNMITAIIKCCRRYISYGGRTTKSSIWGSHRTWKGMPCNIYNYLVDINRKSMNHTERIRWLADTYTNTCKFEDNRQNTSKRKSAKATKSAAYWWICFVVTGN